MLTIDDAITALHAAAQESKLSGDTVLVLSLSDSELETVPIDAIKTVNDDSGAVVEVRCTHPSLVGDQSVFARYVLATEIYNYVYDNTQSFEFKDKVGPDLAYLLGGILTGHGAEFSRHRRIIRLLRERYDETAQIWKVVSVISKKDKKVKEKR